MEFQTLNELHSKSFIVQTLTEFFLILLALHYWLPIMLLPFYFPLKFIQVIYYAPRNISIDYQPPLLFVQIRTLCITKRHVLQFPKAKIRLNMDRHWKAFLLIANGDGSVKLKYKLNPSDTFEIMDFLSILANGVVTNIKLHN